MIAQPDICYCILWLKRNYKVINQKIEQVVLNTLVLEHWHCLGKTTKVLASIRGGGGSCDGWNSLGPIWGLVMTRRLEV